MKKHSILSIFCVLSISCCTSQTNKNINQVKQSGFVIHETKDAISYLINVQKYDDTENENSLQSGEENFYLMFDINNRSKTRKSSTDSRYMMRVTTVNGTSEMKLQLQSLTFYEDGVNTGHAEPSGEWYEDDKLAALVLDYYHSNKTTIPVHTKNVDISRWKPLFTLSKENNASQHVLKLTLSKFDSATGQFTLDCELLTVSNVMINNELSNYSISTHTLLFIPETRYLVQMKHNSTIGYTNGGKDVTEYQIPNKVEEFRYADEILFSRKVLEYYLSHKNEFEVNTNNF